MTGYLLRHPTDGSDLPYQKKKSDRTTLRHSGDVEKSAGGISAKLGFTV
jgi:hypothetical protein